MAKTRSFSIFLLKSDRSEANCFKGSRPEEGRQDLSELPEGSSLFVIENEPKAPWWLEFFGVDADLEQSQHGALFILSILDRKFCLCFGLVHHLLEEDAYEHDFGIRVTLNCIDPLKLKSTDKVDPGPARRQRTQLPTETELNAFDFDYESDILRSLTGKVRDEFKHLFRHATGSSNLRIGSKASVAELLPLCEKLLELYNSNELLKSFPGFRDVRPVKDPTIVKMLDEQLLNAIKLRMAEVNLMVPDIINYNSNVFAAFSGMGESEPKDDVFIGNYIDYLEGNGFDMSLLSVADLKKHQLMLVDENGIASQRFSIFRCLVFDFKKDNLLYHLRERQWYQVEASFLANLKLFLDGYWRQSTLPPYKDATEGAYNLRVAASDKNLICLDLASISQIANNRVEPCDLYSVVNGTRVFYHVKISTLSNALSHLFNQGPNPLALLKTEPVSREKLQTLISNTNGKHLSIYDKDMDDMRDVNVVFAIVTRKDPGSASDNLPLFSRISLRRSVKALLAMSANPSFMFVEDQT